MTSIGLSSIGSEGYTSELARAGAADALGRLLRYVRIDTQADPSSATVPTTRKQLDLSRLLVDELHTIGLADAELDEHGYVLATLPATVDRAVPTIALLAHVDVAPDAPAAGVEPQVVRYEGGRLPLPGNPDVALDPELSPYLRGCVGHLLVTSDGSTLLGADNKAGVAEIMAAVAHLVRHPEIAHGDLRICFTRDEEVGRGVELLDLDRLGAEAAYTIDGSDVGSIENETFSAREATVTFTGIAVHPGDAKGRKVNAVKVAGDFLASLPRGELSPETTEGREGFVNPMSMSGVEGEVTIAMNLRDFDEDVLEGHEQLVRRLAAEAVAGYPGSSVRVDVVQPYRNMKEYLAGHPRVIEAAAEAMRAEGLTPKQSFVRGGTDGARLSQLGLPTPNLFSGQQDIHALNEWISVVDIGAAVATIVHLAAVWAGESTGPA